MADGINLGKAYVQIIPSAEGISGSISGLLDGEAASAGKSSGGKFSSAMGGVLKTGLGVAAAGAAAIGTMSKSIIDGAKNTAAMGDNIDKLSQKIGISATAFQEWDYVFGQNGADISILETGMKTLSSAVADAGNGSKSAMEKFELLGVSYEELGKMSQEDIFSTVIARLQEMPEGAERTSIAADLLGKSAMELGPLLNQTAEDTQALKDQAHDLGMVMSDEAVKDSAAFTDSMDNLSRAMDGAKNQLSTNFLPGLTEVTNGFAELIAGSDGASEKISSGFESIAAGITDALPGLVETISTLAVSIAEVAPEILGTLAQSLIDSIPELLPAATELILQLAQMIIEMLPQIIEVGLQVIVQLALGIAQALPDLIPTIIDCVLMIVETLIDNVDLLIDASIALILGLAEGLINALPVLIEKAPEIVEKLLTAIIENAPKLVMAAIELVFSLIKGIGENLPKIVEAGWKIVTSIIKGIGEWLSKLPETGAKIIGKIKEGIAKLNPLQWGKDLIDNFIKGITGGIQAVKDAVGKVAGAVKDFLGFSEPEDGPLSNFHTFAPDMMKLFAHGIDQNVGVVTDSVEDMSAQVAGAMKNDLDGAAFDVAANVSTNGRGGMDSVNMGGVTIQVYGAPGQDERVIAQRVSEILNRQVINARAVFA